MRLLAFTVSCALTTALFANEYTINDLLTEDNAISAITSKTKKESLGHAIVFSQNDLAMMQAKKLKDILKIIPVTSIQTNLFGVSNLTYAGNPNGISTSMRVYINDHEVSSIQTLSPWLIYENYPLDHISHIEIYIGESSLMLGNEPSNLTIKLYTKKPELLNSGAFSTSLASKSSSALGLYYGAELQNVSILTMVSDANENKFTTNRNNTTIKNDNHSTFGYVSLEVDDYIVDAGYAQLTKDTFVGLAKDATPDSGELKSQDYFVSVTKHFQKDNAKIYFAIDKNDRVFSETNSNGSLVLPVIPNIIALATNDIPTNYAEDLTFTKYDFTISKELEINGHNLFLGGSYKRKDYIVNHRNITPASQQNLSDIKNESILSCIFEDNYYVNQDNMLVLNARYDKYFKNGDFKDRTEFSQRIGFVSMPTQNFGIKGFVTNSFTPPSMYEIDFAAGKTTNEKDLKNESKKIYSIEGVYENENHKLSLYTNYLTIEDSIALDLTRLGHVNSNNTIKAGGFFTEYKRKFDTSNEVSLNFYRFHSNKGAYFSPREGSIIKAFQKVANFDFYEEVIFKKSYTYGGHTHIDSSTNLSLGINYHISNNLVFGFKGENVLDDDMKVVYPDLTNIATPQYFTIANSDRKMIAQLTWTF